MQHKREQLESSLQRILGQLLTQGISDPRVKGLISVVSVKMNAEVYEADINISVLPNEYAKATIAGLQHAAVHLQNEVAKKIRIRRVPKFKFVIDDSLKKQAAVLDEINKAVAEDQSKRIDTDNVSAEQE